MDFDEIVLYLWFLLLATVLALPFYVSHRSSVVQKAPGPAPRWRVYSTDGRWLFTADQVGTCDPGILFMTNATDGALGNLKAPQRLCVPEIAVILVSAWDPDSCKQNPKTMQWECGR